MNPTELSSAPGGMVLRLMVRNHPGVTSARMWLVLAAQLQSRCDHLRPVEDGARSEILLLVRESDRLEQLVLQLRKLEDVIEVSYAPALRAAFEFVAGIMK